MTRSTRRLRAVATVVVGAVTMERLVDPILSDIDIEQRESVQSGRRWRARWIVVRGYVGLARALALHGLHSCARGAVSEAGAARAVTLSIGAFVVLTLLLTSPAIVATPRRLRPDAARLAITLLPQAIPLSLPLAVAFGILAAWPKRVIRRIMLKRTVVLGIAGIALTLATMEWLVPAGNQAFREIVFRRLTDAGVSVGSIHLPRGLDERSVSELVTLVRRSSQSGVDGPDPAIRELSAADAAFEPSRLRLQLQLRLVLSSATALLCLLAAAIANAIDGRTLGRIIFAGVTVSYAVTFFGISAMARVVSPAIAPWLPTLALTIVSAVLLRMRPAPSSGQ